jgi:hypothetical protein
VPAGVAMRASLIARCALQFLLPRIDPRRIALLRRNLNERSHKRDFKLGSLRALVDVLFDPPH